MGDLIANSAELKAACKIISERGVLALDTEFIAAATYRPKLGVVQIGADERNCWVLDCMCGMDVTPLGDLLANPLVVKILHDAKTDLTLLHYYTNAMPVNVFDTQLAASFCDFGLKIGLQKLLGDAIDVHLSKTETCTNWIQRPLSEAQVKYALNDVRYLPELRNNLIERARTMGTLDWLNEDMLQYEIPESYCDVNPEDAWLRINTTEPLDRHGFAILRAIAAKREELARQWNMPRNWLGDNKTLVAMALKHRLGPINCRLHGGKVETLRLFYKIALQQALKLPEEDCPENPSRYYIREVINATQKASAWLKNRAAELHIAPAIVANGAELIAFVDDVNDPDNPLSNGWRYEQFGREIAELFGVE